MATTTATVTYTLSVDLAIGMLGMFKRKAEKVIMDTALNELKRRVESLEAGTVGVATDPVRDEAERLVAAAIAAVSMAARGLGGRNRGGPWSTGAAGGFATGSAECCVCPVCRVIAAMREPDVDLAERLASGAGDLAGGVTALLRSFSRRSRDEEDADDAWHTATSSAAGRPHGEEGDREEDRR